ncbi:MAG: thiamine pyrophosphate-binding protein [Desulfobacterales bacterium]|nr:MAG: thiamine pyrophosphate-binding protein [Desulfobacterales bacterium]
MRTRGGDIIVDYLVESGVPYAIGVCGHGNIQLMDALRLRSDRIKTMTTHHESAAGFIADAYFRVSHQPLTTFSSTGPGSYNMPIALANAMGDGSAFLAITGDVPNRQYDRGAFQETFWHQGGDFTSVIRPYVKRVFQPQQAAMLPSAIRQAYTTMLKGRFGPVNLDVPFNLFIEDVHDEPQSPRAWQDGLDFRSGGNPAVLEHVLDLLSGAKRPLILAGNGVVLSKAEERLREFAKLLKIPVANTPLAKGVMDISDDLAAGEPGRLGVYSGNQACKACDVLLTLGCRFDDRVSSSWLNGYTFNIPPTRHIQVDIDPKELGRNYPIECGIMGDVHTVLGQLLDTFRARGRQAQTDEQWRAEVVRWKRAWEPVYEDKLKSDATPIRPERLIHDLREIFPEDGILLSDVGSHHNWLVQLWNTSHARTFLHAWGFGAMGFGVCGVIGAKLAAPDRPCIAVVRDGGFMMHAHAVSTAVEYNTPVIWIIWNNKGYCSIRDMQLNYFQGHEIATSFIKEQTGELFTPDFAAIAESCGARGLRVERPSEIKDALQKALRAQEPYVVEVNMEREARFTTVGTWELPPFPHAEPTFHPTEG